MIKQLFLVAALYLAAESSALGQSTGGTSDAQILESVNSVYTIISGDKGVPRDWERFTSLFAEGATLGALVHDTSGVNRIRLFSVDEFVALGKRFYEENGFEEYPMKTVVHTYNGIAQVFQSYTAIDPQTTEQGVNCLQLAYDGRRWLITSILWTSNRNGVQLPAEMRE